MTPEEQTQAIRDKIIELTNKAFVGEVTNVSIEDRMKAYVESLYPGGKVTNVYSDGTMIYFDYLPPLDQVVLNFTITDDGEIIND